MSTHRDKAADLVRLAVAPTATPGEAANAAMAACRLIARHDLLAPPRATAHSPWTESQWWGQYPRQAARRPGPSVLPSELVTLAEGALCRGCMQRIVPGARGHRIDGRGSQCEECGPWSAPAPARA